MSRRLLTLCPTACFERSLYILSPFPKSPEVPNPCCWHLPRVSRAADCLINSLINYLSPSNVQRVWWGLCSPPSPRLNHSLLNHHSSFITQIKRHRPASPAQETNYLMWLIKSVKTCVNFRRRESAGRKIYDWFLCLLASHFPKHWSWYKKMHVEFEFHLSPPCL